MQLDTSPPAPGDRVNRVPGAGSESPSPGLNFSGDFQYPATPPYDPFHSPASYPCRGKDFTDACLFNTITGEMVALTSLSGFEEVILVFPQVRQFADEISFFDVINAFKGEMAYEQNDFPISGLILRDYRLL
ncbi:MAG: hypothetical protein ACRER2_16775 [Methylococcales bacterium]